MASAARRQIIGGGAPINKSRRWRPQIVGGGAVPAHGSTHNHHNYINSVGQTLLISNFLNYPWPWKCP